MTREIKEIQQNIVDRIASVSSLNALEILTDKEVDNVDVMPRDKASKVSRWRLMVYVFAFSVWVFEQILEVFISDVDAKIRENEVHNFEWYHKKALSFQYGHVLPSDTDLYDNSLLSESDIRSSKIISNVSVVRKIAGGHGYLEMKLAKGSTVLEPLSKSEIEAFSAYMYRVADAGTYIDYISLPADTFKADITVYYDPLILDQNGARRDGDGNTPVEDAINKYLAGLSFNGELVLTHLVDYLQKVQGVKIPVVENAQAKFGKFDFQSMEEVYQARSGYMRLEEGIEINYIAREQ